MNGRGAHRGAPFQESRIAVKLVIANKNYSSWSLRPWLVLTHFGMPFEEEMVLLSGEGWQEKFRAISPTARVPLLIDGDLVIPELLAIIEYLAEDSPRSRFGQPTSGGGRWRGRRLRRCTPGFRACASTRR